MTETLALAMSRLDREMAALEDVKTFSAVIENATDYDIVSRAIDDLAKEHNVYIGEKRWFRTPSGDYELRVGFARTLAIWADKYGASRKGYRYDDFRL